ncbi:MAG: class I tRNA ligase family protein [Methanomassiliicoccales archaeon]|nr:class I tRNA ligase family protein [Methanomassiliicoccales archaeon]
MQGTDSVVKAEARRRRRIDRVDSSFTIIRRLPLERERAEGRIIELAREEPYEVIVVLLRHMSLGSRRTKEDAARLLRVIVDERSGMKAVVDAAIHPNQGVHTHAIELLKEKIGIRAITYASFYQNASLLVSIARSKDIPVADIEALIESSKDSLVDGEVMEALMDVGTSLDYLKHRLRAANMLRGYLSEVLKMAPDLSRMGVYDERIEEPLKRAIQASKGRFVDETSEIVVQRKLEAAVRADLDVLCRGAVAGLKSKPSLEPTQLTGPDVWALSGLGTVVQDVTTLLVSGEKEESLNRVDDFVRGEAVPYLQTSEERRKAGDQSALVTAYTLALVGLRLASGVMPQATEDIYQRRFRTFEREPSVHIVAWPEIVLKVMGQTDR